MRRTLLYVFHFFTGCPEFMSVQTGILGHKLIYKCNGCGRSFYYPKS